jgi:hypothetical protein
MTRNAAFSTVVRDCRWVAIVGDDFEATARQVSFRNYFGEQSHQIIDYCDRRNQAKLISELKTAYGSAGGTKIVFVETT